MLPGGADPVDPNPKSILPERQANEYQIFQSISVHHAWRKPVSKTHYVAKMVVSDGAQSVHWASITLLQMALFRILLPPYNFALDRNPIIGKAVCSTVSFRSPSVGLVTTCVWWGTPERNLYVETYTFSTVIRINQWKENQGTTSALSDEQEL